MSLPPNTARHVVEHPSSTRDFDYGVGDDLRSLERQLRRDIAARIRQEAWLDPAGTQRERLAYEQAAQIAEGARGGSAEVSAEDAVQRVSPRQNRFVGRVGLEPTTEGS